MSIKHLTPTLATGQSVKVIGLGGVGGIVARYGAMFLAPLAAAGGARLVLIDGDSFEPSNATRMFFSSAGNKSEVTLAAMAKQFEGSRLTLLAVPKYIEPGNLAQLVREGDIILLCVDNHATRKLTSDFCATLKDVTLISGGNDGVDENHAGTYGNCQVYIRRDGKDASPSLTRYHKEIGTPQDVLPTMKSCTDALESTPQLVLANLAAASSILNALLLHLCDETHYSELAFDIRKGLARPIMDMEGGAP